MQAGGHALIADHDPALDAFLDETRQMNRLIEAFMPQVPSFADPDGLEQLRENDGFFGRPPIDGVVEGVLPGPAGPIPARFIAPETAAVEAVYLELHGGGWCIGRAAASDAYNEALAQAAGIAVVSIDYRLAPEHPFPAGPDDCEAAAVWLLEHAAAEWGTDRLMIGGGSAGAHLAALTLLRVRDHHGADAVARFVAADLQFGVFDLGLTPSQRFGRDALAIPLAMLEACYAHALPGLDREARRDPSISPLYADLSGLPPALFTVGTIDPLLDDTLFMAARWAVAGNDAELAIYPECVHGFNAFPTEMAQRANDRIAQFLLAHSHDD